MQITTIKDAIESNTPSFSLLKRQYGEVKAEAYIKMWILDLVGSINTARTLSESQIDEIAMLILSEYYMITITDISLIFKNAKTGKYGNLYETLSMDKILSWFNEYFNERCSIGGMMTRNEHIINTRAEREVRTRGTFKEELSRVKSDLMRDNLAGNDKK